MKIPAGVNQQTSFRGTRPAPNASLSASIVYVLSQPLEHSQLSSGFPKTRHQAKFFFFENGSPEKRPVKYIFPI